MSLAPIFPPHGTTPPGYNIFEGLSSDDEPVPMPGLSPGMNLARDVVVFVVGAIVGAVLVAAVVLV